MKKVHYILLFSLWMIFLVACDSPTELDENIKKTSIEKNITESSGLLIENDSVISPPINGKIVFDTTNLKGSSGIIETYNYYGDYYMWERKVFWFDAFKIEIDTAAQNISFNIDIKTNDLQKYSFSPSDRIGKFQIQIKDLDYSEPQTDLPLNSALGESFWSSYTVRSVNAQPGEGQIKIYEGRSSLAFLSLIPRKKKDSQEIAGLSIMFVLNAEQISLPYPGLYFNLVYQLELYL